MRFDVLVLIVVVGLVIADYTLANGFYSAKVIELAGEFTRLLPNASGAGLSSIPDSGSGQSLTRASCQRGGCVFGACAFARRVPWSCTTRRIDRGQANEFNSHAALMGLAVCGFNLQQPFVVWRK